MRTLLLALLLALGSPLVAAQGPITLETPETEPPVPRIRVGGEIGGGIAYGNVSGGALAGYFQFGGQVSRQLGIFYQGALFGIGFGSESGVDGIVTSSHSAMIDLTFGNVAQVGIGGGVDVGRLVDCVDLTGVCTRYGTAAHASLSLRAAFLVAFARENSRWGMPIALHAHTILWEHQAQNALVVTIGFSRY